MMKTLAEQIANRCEHFNGTQNDKCKAGVTYADLQKGKKLGALPCFKDEAEKSGVGCEFRLFPTPEEVQAQVEESNRGMERIRKARKAIIATRLDHGAIQCPVCQKDKALRFTVAYNGHVHASCANGCVAWME